MNYPDIRHDEPAAEYHIDNAHVSNSMLGVFAKSPALFRGRFVDRDARDEKPSDQMLLGSLVHTWLLEPDRLHEEYIEVAASDRRTKALKEASAKAGECDLIAIAQPMWQKAQRMVEAVRNSRIANYVLSPIEEAMIETSVRWIDNRTRIPCKARLDAIYENWHGNGPAVVDLKTSRDPRPRPFNGSAWTYGYRRQAAWYLRAASQMGLETRTFRFIVVGSEPPHDVYDYLVSDTDLDRERGRIDRMMEDLADCHRTGEWVATSQLTELTLGDFSHEQIEGTDDDGIGEYVDLHDLAQRDGAA